MRIAIGTTALLLALAAAPAPVLAQTGRIVDCRVESGGKVEFNGKCRFLADGTNGSFSLGAGNKQAALYGSILSVSVSVISPGVAEVRGLTRDGINSRWGEAKRSARDAACWDGSDFRICAR